MNRIFALALAIGLLATTQAMACIPPESGEIRLCELQELRFGTVVAPLSGNGSVTIGSDGSRAVSGGAEVLDHGFYHEARYRVQGDPGRSITITLLPGTGISSLTSSVGTSAQLDGSGLLEFSVGATVSGLNTTGTGNFSSSFDVIVAY